ncbi:DUF305 domain-containing protein [Rhodococcus aerolatus]
MTTDTLARPEPEAPRRPRPRSEKPALLVLAVVVLVGLGFLAGATLGPSGSGDTLTVPAADSVDVGFLQDMTVHHQQAVQMANVAYVRAQAPEVRSLAFDILTSQQAQIGQMQGWLTLWGRAQLPTGPYMTWMAGSPMAAGMGAMPAGGVAQMPGMASQDDLAALSAATGTDVDTLFLQLMLRHHQGGAGMLSYAAANAGQPVVASFAKQVSGTQVNEAEYMTTLLAQRGAQPLPLTG